MMRQKTSKYLISCLVVLLAGAGVFLFVKNTQLKAFNDQLQEAVVKAESKETALKKKYSEEKAKATAFQRAKLAADSQMRALETEIESFQEELAGIQQAHRIALEQLETEKAATKAALDDLSREYEALVVLQAKTASALETAENEINDFKKDLAAREGDIKKLQSQVKTASRKNDRIVSHNKELAELAEELLAEFDNRDVFNTLLEKEPFTQAKRVSLEQMIQEYLDRIDDNVLSGADGY